ncbi:MAG: endonuclease [Erysipelotrichaceae bacterium]|jgi:endonuclease I|nr:endonuclease [Erysipelotrichaceae bacterium]
MKKRNLLILFALVATLSACDADISSSISDSFTSGGDVSSSDVGNSTTSSEPGPALTGYYSTISSTATGTTLLGQLQSLNSAKRIRTIGYKNFGSYYLKTDGDPQNSKNVITFYSGKSVAFSGSFSGSINREHVWPNSRGGNLVEADIHMARPTLATENGSRGNAFFVEGGNSQSGWDPNNFGQDKYRGISARIIFYCAVASNQLSLVDSTNGSGNTMGKLSDLLKWNLQYAIDATEVRRNEAIAGSDIQGNRNPFIDHPEFACKIWGNTNSTTKAVCGI